MVKVDSSIFKGYDIRGIYPDTLNEEIAYKVGQAYVETVKPQGEILVGEDVRIYSHVLKENLIRGILDSGVDVVDVGLISTDMSYFGVGKYELSGGIQVTASHNPPEWHGFKMVRKGPIAMSLETGISQIRDLITSDSLSVAPKKGQHRNFSVLEDYCDYILSWLGNTKVKPMKVVINANFGFAGKVFRRIVEKGNLPLEIIGLNDEPNGNFPKGRPDPLITENRVEFCNLVASTEADFGISWDADADRVFFAGKGGVYFEPYYLNTLLIRQMLNKFPGEKIIYDPRYTWALIETIEQSGGKPILVRVGHSYIKEAMRKHQALYATESSGHTYYRDFWFADNGMIPVIQVLEYLSSNDTSLLDAIKPMMDKYIISGEINNEVADKGAKIEEISNKYPDAKQSRLDGIAVEYDDWRFCVRPSNTESLLRLTLEAKSQDLMERKRDEILSLIKS